MPSARAAARSAARNSQQAEVLRACRLDRAARVSSSDEDEEIDDESSGCAAGFDGSDEDDMWRAGLAWRSGSDTESEAEDGEVERAAYSAYVVGADDNYDVRGEPLDDDKPAPLCWDARFATNFSQLPTAADWDEATATAPKPEAWDNPPAWRGDPPFVAGCVTRDADPAAWTLRLGEVSPWALRIMRANGHALQPDARPELSRENYDMEPREQHALDGEVTRVLGYGALRLWLGDVPPTWVSPLACVPKKTLDANGDPELRLVYDMKRTGNQHLRVWRQRFEGIKWLPAIARRGFVAATLDVKKGYWCIGCTTPDLLGAKARLRPSWIRDACAAASARLGRDATEGDIEHADWAAVDTEESEDDSTRGEWVTRHVVWTCLPMGCAVSGSVFVTIMRQFVKKWRKNGRLLLHFVDDLLAVAATDAELFETVTEMVEDLTALGMPVSFKKSHLGYMDAAGEYRGHSCVEFLGMILFFGDASRSARVFVKECKLQALLRLVRSTGARLKRGDGVKLIELARICGRIVSNQAALQPARLMTRSMFGAMHCQTAADYERHLADADHELVCAEISFWARNLLTFARLGAPMFPDDDPFTLEIDVDAGPEGWGARMQARTESVHTTATEAAAAGLAARARAAAASEDGTGAPADGGGVGDAWHANDASAGQVVRELRGVEQALHEFVRGGKINLRDRAVRLRTTSEETAVWAQYGLRRQFTRPEDRVLVFTDCEGARKYLVKGGGRSVALQAVTVRIWSFLLQHGATLDALWVSGKTMLAIGVDALSRQPWAPDAKWRLTRGTDRKLAAVARRHGWLKEGQRLCHFGPAAIRNGVAAAWCRWDTELAVVRPGAALRQWMGVAVQRGLRMLLVLPLWFGPEMGAIARASGWHLPLGRCGAVCCVRDGLLPNWLMMVHAVDFARDARRPQHEDAGAAHGEEQSMEGSSPREL